MVTCARAKHEGNWSNQSRKQNCREKEWQEV